MSAGNATSHCPHQSRPATSNPSAAKFLCQGKNNGATSRLAIGTQGKG